MESERFQMSRWQWKWYSPCFWFSKSKKQEKSATVCVVRETTKMSLLFSNPPPMHIWRSNIRKNTDFLVLKWDNMMKNHRIYCYTSELNSDQMFLEVRESTICNRSYIKNHVPILQSNQVSYNPWCLNVLSENIQVLCVC